MKFTNFQDKHRIKHFPANENDLKAGWNAACKKILSKIKYKNKMFEGNWQHEDVDYLVEEIKDLIEK